MSKLINLFVSHKGEDESKIDAFKRLMKNKGYDFRDSSIRESEPNNARNKDYIRYEILKPAIDWAGTVVVLIGEDTYSSEWVDWEVNYAMEHDKKVIGVFLQGATNAQLPDALKDFGDSCVSWNADKIDEVIRSDKQVWEDADGHPMAPNNPSRVTC